jgi:hypothetical protein
MAHLIPKQRNDAMLTKIKVKGFRGAEAARRSGGNVKPIYRWLADGVGGTSGHGLEINRLRPDNQQRTHLIGLLLEHERETTLDVGRQARNPSQLARDLGRARSSRADVPKRDALDEERKRQWEAVMMEHPAYGHTRIALHRTLSHNRVRRGLQAAGRRATAPASGTPLERAQRMAAICREYDVPLTAAALQFSLRDARITSAIVGLDHPDQVAQTLDLARHPIPDALWQRLDAVGFDTGDL